MSKQVMREEFATFLKVADTFHIMGEGIQDMGIAYNPKTSEVHYIHEKNARTSLTGYALSTEVEQEAYFGDPLFDFIDNLRNTLATGSAVVSEILLVNVYDHKTQGYVSQKFACKIIVGELGGGGGESLKISYTVSIEGNPVNGHSTITDGKATFTPSA